MEERTRPLPRLCGYLDEVAGTELRHIQARKALESVQEHAWWVAGAIAFAVADLGCFGSILAAVVAGSVVGLLVSLFNAASERRRQKRDPIRFVFQSQLQEFRDFQRRSTLHERLHPAVAARLEEAAGLRADILAAATAETGARKEAAQQAVEAANAAMRHAISLAAGAYRPKGMKRKAWEQHVALDPEARPQAAELHEILEGLGELKTALGGGAKGSLREALENLREIERAEEELDASL